MRPTRSNPAIPIYQGQKLIIPNAKGVSEYYSPLPNSRWKYIVIHHTATDVGKAYLINRSHLDRGFWNGLGYHFLIDNGTLGKGDGQIEAALPLDQATKRSSLQYRRNE